MSRLSRIATSLSLALVAGCGGTTGLSGPPGATGTTAGVPVWTAPDDPMGLATQAGLTPDRKEYIDYHVHAHLDVFVNGQPVEIPSGIGLDADAPEVERFGTEIGGIPPEGCAEVCISPLHTHDIDGIIHTEAQTESEFTLGQFFQEMEVRLDATCVDEFCTPETPIAVYINGDARTGNPADIVLTDLQQITIVVGTPPAEIPAAFPEDG